MPHEMSYIAMIEVNAYREGYQIAHAATCCSSACLLLLPPPPPATLAYLAQDAASHEKERYGMLKAEV